MDQYTIYCTEEQTKKALQLGAPILSYKDAFISDSVPHYVEYEDRDRVVFVIPTAEQMLGWLEEQFFSEIDICKEGEGWCYDIFYSHKKVRGRANFYTRQEATLAAINGALEYLSNQKNK